MTALNDLLIEIGTEELPPKTLTVLADAFAERIRHKLNTAELKFKDIKIFATPRRLALLIEQLSPQQADRLGERRGPALRAPTTAVEGFARSCGVSIEQLEKLETPQGSWFIYRYQEKGKSLKELLPAFITEALAELPIAKRMRWGNKETEFVRPVHWAVLLYGEREIKAEILGCKTSRHTYGHRFMAPKALAIKKAGDYEKILKQKGKVIADFAKRKELIRQEILKIARKIKCSALINEHLLNEVTGIVEWPVGLLASFDKDFLTIPHEALIAAMQDHQKSFPVENAEHELQPYFITISNIQSKKTKEVIHGNERVMRARLSDAKFFYETDCKQKLSDRLENLKNVVFQEKLGSLYDKSQRIAQLAALIAKQVGYEDRIKNIARAGLLCKADLTSNMVGEFPELQGIMGFYYAQRDGEDIDVALAISEHYRPRFSTDSLPKSITGSLVGLADRLDTLINIFGINQAPTGEKDPFGLRRAALGVIRIIIERKLNLDNRELFIKFKNDICKHPIANNDALNQVHNFILERLPAWYQEQNIAVDNLKAVLGSEQNTNNLLDIHHRVLALQQLPSALIAINKRIANILAKCKQMEITTHLNPIELIKLDFITAPAERNLYSEITNIHSKMPSTINTVEGYVNFLALLATLQPVIDKFFDDIMVMDEKIELRTNHLALLAAIRKLFLQVADISLLQG